MPAVLGVHDPAGDDEARGARARVDRPRRAARTRRRSAAGWRPLHAAGAERLRRDPGRRRLRLGPLVLPNDPAHDWPTLLRRPAGSRRCSAGARRRLARPGRRRARSRRSASGCRARRPARAARAPARRPVERQRRDGRAVLIDPAAYGGHREVDLAMLRLFGSPGPAFLAAYEEVAPLAAGHERAGRALAAVPLLVHAVLFGGGYGASAERAARRVRLTVPRLLNRPIVRRFRCHRPPSAASRRRRWRDATEVAPGAAVLASARALAAGTASPAAAQWERCPSLTVRRVRARERSGEVRVFRPPLVRLRAVRSAASSSTTRSRPSTTGRPRGRSASTSTATSVAGPASSGRTPGSQQPTPDSGTTGSAPSSAAPGTTPRLAAVPRSPAPDPGRARDRLLRAGRHVHAGVRQLRAVPGRRFCVWTNPGGTADFADLDSGSNSPG